MQGYRRITGACAKRDWNVSTHDEVLARNGGSHLLRRFLTDKSLDHCYAGANVLDRARDRVRGAPAPGPHILGNFHIRAPAARRAWLWRDTGELEPAVRRLKIDWMIAQGARRQGDRTDLQVARADILRDPHDSWLPDGDDYARLAAETDKRWIDRACQAVVLAVHEAQEHRGQLVAVDIDKVTASIAQDFSVRVNVIEDLAERWVMIDRLDTDKQPVDPDTAFALADAAFDGISEEDVAEVLRKTTILDGAHVIDPGRVYAWSAIV